MSFYDILIKTMNLRCFSPIYFLSEIAAYCFQSKEKSCVMYDKNTPFKTNKLKKGWDYVVSYYGLRL